MIIDLHLEIETAYDAYELASFLKRRVPELEPLILKSISASRNYANNIIQRRWPEGEGKIREDRFEWSHYLAFNKHNRCYSETEQLQWLQEEGVTDKLFEFLDFTGMSLEAQIYIIRRRPDLINKITKLDPKIKKEFPHEWNLAGIEI